MKKLLFVFGTRPEAIKMAPIIIEARKHPSTFSVHICVTGQHKEMLNSVMDFFELTPDEDLNVMKHNQTLYDITGAILKGLEEIYTAYAPDLVLVQGDTTTAFAAALAAYYKKISVAHIEAGLRSGDKYAPFPEEVNRKLIGSIADFHFAPTEASALHLKNENITKNVFVTGNTVIDALLWGVQKIRNDEAIKSAFSYLDFSKKIILVTGHRRENFGQPFENICLALEKISNRFPDFQIVYPVHLNPNVQDVVRQKLSNKANIFLIAPLDYPHFIWLLDRSYLVITDSGGIQEEAPSLGKPVLIMRNVTERMEGVSAGTAMLVGTNTDTIFDETCKLITDEQHYKKMSMAKNPYGDGTSAVNIVGLLFKLLV